MFIRIKDTKWEQGSFPCSQNKPVPLPKTTLNNTLKLLYPTRPDVIKPQNQHLTTAILGTHQIQVSGDVPTLPSLRSKVWVGAGSRVRPKDGKGRHVPRNLDWSRIRNTLFLVGPYLQFIYLTYGMTNYHWPVGHIQKQQSLSPVLRCGSHLRENIGRFSECFWIIPGNEHHSNCKLSNWQTWFRIQRSDENEEEAGYSRLSRAIFKLTCTWGDTWAQELKDRGSPPCNQASSFSRPISARVM